MPDPTLTVTAARLRELAAAHDHAAAGIGSAARAVTDVDARVIATHGVIASTTARALGLVQGARAGAAAHLAGASQALSGHLADAARRYESTDRSSADRLRL